MQSLPHQSPFFITHHLAIGRRQGADRINQSVAFLILSLQRQRHLATTAFGRDLFGAVISRLIGRNTKQPGLQPALTAKAIEIFDHREKHLLTHLVAILTRKCTGEWEHITPHCRIMLGKELIPRIGLTGLTALDQLAFQGHIHQRQFKL